MNKLLKIGLCLLIPDAIVLGVVLLIYLRYFISLIDMAMLGWVVFGTAVSLLHIAAFILVIVGLLAKD